MNECMRLSKSLLEILGIFDTESEWSLWWLKSCVFLSSMVILFAAELFELFQVSKDFRHFNDNLSMVLLGAIGIANFVTLIYYREGMIDLKDSIDQDKINGDSSINDNSILERHDRAGLKLSKSVAYAIVGVSTGVILQSLPDTISGTRYHLPVAASYPFSLNSTEIFIIVYISQVVSCYFFVLTMVTSSLWLIFLTYHACGNFRVLQNYFERIAEDDNWGMDTRRRIIKCVKLHQNIYNMTDSIEKYLSISNLIHFLVSSVGLCTSAYEISLSLNEPEQLVKHVSAAIAQFALLFIVNWCGQLIQNESVGVSLAVNRSNFYKLDTRYQKDLLFISLRAQRPVYITAGKFYNLSMESTTNILKASMSCFAMFTNID